MEKNFSDLGISPPILKALEEMGFEAPTEVQSKVIPHILNKEDLIVIAKTGSGKTAVFGIPILQMTDPETEGGPQALILTPTRELAVQIDNELKKISQFLTHQTTAVYGQHSLNIEIQALKKGSSIVAGTPGRVFDHIRHKNLIVKNIRFLVIDEADRMLDMGFIDQVFKIIKTLPRNRITLLFSATIPEEIQAICRGYMKQPATIEMESQTKTVDTIDQVYYRVNRNEKRTQLHNLLMVERPESCLIFCNTKIAVDHVQSFLLKKGYASQALHGDIPQGKRLKIIQQFKQGEFPILIATDIAARGIHIDDLSLVINYDVPLEKDNYVHRIGRTGRAGKVGCSITFVTGDDIMSLYAIEEHIGALIAEAELPSESEINACRAESEKWIREKYQNSSLAKAETREKAPAKEKKHPSKSRPQKDRSESGPQKERSESRPQKERSESRLPREKPQQRPPEEQSKPRPPRDKQQRPPRDHSKPITIKEELITGTEKPDTVQAAETVKKPFLKRILEQIRKS